MCVCKEVHLPSKAPTCCVMPPASFAATEVLRRVSSRVVFPWSTCPMMVTTGGRCLRLGSSSLITLDGRERVDTVQVQCTGEHAQSSGECAQSSGGHAQSSGEHAQSSGEHAQSSGEHAQSSGEHAQSSGGQRTPGRIYCHPLSLPSLHIYFF